MVQPLECEDTVDMGDIHRRTGQHPFGGSNPVLPEWSRTNVLSFARINVISARIGGSTDPPYPPSRTPMLTLLIAVNRYIIVCIPLRASQW